jgi:hypothetical protein
MRKKTGSWYISLILKEILLTKSSLEKRHEMVYEGAQHLILQKDGM